MNPLRLLIAVAPLALAPFGFAQVTQFDAWLSGLNEVPPNASPASGYAHVAYDAFTHTLDVDLSFTGLTALASASHIHAPALPGTNASVAVGFPSFPNTLAGSYSHTFDLTQTSVYTAGFLAAHGGTAANAESALFTFMKTNQAYVNIHNSVYPGGEIRGQLAVPDAGSTALLLAPALLFLSVWRRRQR